MGKSTWMCLSAGLICATMGVADATNGRAAWAFAQGFLSGANLTFFFWDLCEWNRRTGGQRVEG